MPDNEYQTKYSAAQKMQLLKSQQAKLEIRAMPEHSQLKLEHAEDKPKCSKSYQKLKKLFFAEKSRKLKLSSEAADSSSSSISKVSFASTGSSAVMPQFPSYKSDVQLSVSKDEQENVLKWKRRTEYIYETERISIKLKEIAAECEKDVELRLTMDDIATRMDVRIIDSCYKL
ncbi:unnamed protein product [Onchocerca flexuosa]|uniref:TPX2 domain-containing protein n=1 Tax=Onchocerca flexuosa TaxID=387005 RepID=A0A183I4F8_9BILA|nr:unnamed protein product [Onchocerca flexuosa]